MRRNDSRGTVLGPRRAKGSFPPGYPLLATSVGVANIGNGGPCDGVAVCEFSASPFSVGTRSVGGGVGCVSEVESMGSEVSRFPT